jgi:hypothetical protein
MFIFLVVLLLSIVMLVILWRLLRKNDIFEGVFLYLFCSFICQHLNFKIFSAYDRLSVAQELFPRVISYLHFGIVLPVILVWFLYAFRLQLTWFTKGLISLLWISFDVLSKCFYVTTGVLESKTSSWYPTVDVFVSLSILILSFLFVKKFHSILRKERIVL